ncbi:MAG: hypothetical protein GDA51_09655 [Ekhidna sp.]|nr:hypothetical protein [Ekhidna sp.]
MQKNTFLILIVWLALSCSSGSSTSDEKIKTVEGEGEFIAYNNPPADGFNREGSDMLAMLLADKAMQAMGGRQAWDNTRFLSWNFFGRRDHLWDKQTGDIRIEVPSNDLTILMNIHSKEGSVYKGGQVMPDSTDYFLEKGYSWWVNDAYWLVMPYKLKDTGVTLKYMREDTTLSGVLSDVIQLTFENTGLTPQNIYEVWIDADSKLVTQWSYYQDSSAAEPQFTLEWTDYKKFGEIMLSGGRGAYKLENIRVFNEISAEVLSDVSQSISLLN